MKNVDTRTVQSFGHEWKVYDQFKMSREEAFEAFEQYFDIFPWGSLPSNSEGFDMGCGSGRWANFCAERVGKLNCIDPSEALDVAMINLAHHKNISFFKNSVDDFILEPESQDFGYSLGVLHHVPDTQGAIKSCASLLKQGAPLLLYMYYDFENRSLWFRLIWKLSDIIRKLIVKLPDRLKRLVTDFIAFSVYFPLARLCLLLENLSIKAESIPLYYYRRRSTLSLRTDARDRFGTPLEKRFSKKEIEKMMSKAGLENIKFSDSLPYWCVVGFKK